MFDYTGKQLGNYRLVRLLGEGGFAQVYLGEHVYLKNRQAATGTILWKYSIDVIESLTDGSLKHTERTMFWQYSMGNPISSPVVDNGVLYISSSSMLHAFYVPQTTF